MSKLKVVNGDVFALGTEKKNSVIIHGANCFKIMGAGVAAVVRTQYPSAFKADVNDKRSPELRFKSFTYFDFGRYVIANAYTQFKPGANVDYDAIEKSLTAVRNKFTGRNFFFPAIGSGIAGGDETKIRKIMADVFKNEDATLVLYNG